jgi:hypothetical protein
METILPLTGLALDIAGVILLFFFGLPPSIDRTGAVRYAAPRKDENEIRKGRIYDSLGRAGLLLILIGFTLQAVPYICKLTAP